MASRLLLVLVLFGLLGDVGAERGREGNALYEEGRYAAAEAAYREGLAALDDTTGAVYAALQNNLGATLLQQETYPEARTAFQRARRAAPTETARIRARFNEGTAAAGAGDRAAALAHYREVLLQRPTHEAARYNYEYLKRQQAASGGGSSSDIDPSDYARRLKEKAEALVARQEYDDAARLMEKGLRQDSTVRAYRDFMARLDDVVQINQRP
ncbi:MAG: tetratricopeptide repeat protein [Salinibacter sp.]